MNCNCEFKHRQGYSCKDCQPLEDKKGHDLLFIIPALIVIWLLVFEILK